MSRKGGSFWNNPFGGLMDLNRDGRTSFGERFTMFRILRNQAKKSSGEHRYTTGDESDWDIFSQPREETNQYDWRGVCEDGSDVDIRPENYETEAEYKAALEEARSAWRDFCEDGSDVDIYPEGYETEEEFEEALEEARSEWRYFCEDGSDVGIYPEDYDTEEEYEEALENARTEQLQYFEVKIEAEILGMKALKAINPSDFPNKRSYEAAYRLCDVQQGTVWVFDEANAETVNKRCEFILNSNELAAKYLKIIAFKDIISIFKFAHKGNSLVHKRIRHFSR